MQLSLQGGIMLDFFCTIGGEDKEKAILRFIELINANDLKVKEITLEGSDGKLHTFGVEGSEMEINRVEEVDEDLPKKYKNYPVAAR